MALDGVPADEQPLGDLGGPIPVVSIWRVGADGLIVDYRVFLDLGSGLRGIGGSM